MRIIKEGTVKYENAEKFKCEKCGCEFESLEDEYWIDNSLCLTSYPAQYYIYSNCPTCHKICRSTKHEKIKQLDVHLTNTLKKTLYDDVVYCEDKLNILGDKK